LAPLPAQAIDDIEVALKQDPVSHELYGVAALIYARAAEDADRQRKAIWAAVALDPPLDGTICSRPPRSDSSIRIGVGSRWAGSSGPAVRLRVVACNARRDALLRRAVDLARLAIESGEHPGFLSRQPSPVPLLQSHPESRKLLQITGADSGVTSPLVLDPLGDRLGLE
jgi:hypothetical protein